MQEHGDLAVLHLHGDQPQRAVNFELDGGLDLLHHPGRRRVRHRKAAQNNPAGTEAAFHRGEPGLAGCDALGRHPHVRIPARRFSRQTRASRSRFEVAADEHRGPSGPGRAHGGGLRSRSRPRPRRPAAQPAHGGDPSARPQATPSSRNSQADSPDASSTGSSPGGGGSDSFNCSRANTERTVADPCEHGHDGRLRLPPRGPGWRDRVQSRRLGHHDGQSAPQDGENRSSAIVTRVPGTRGTRPCSRGPARPGPGRQSALTPSRASNHNGRVTKSRRAFRDRAVLTLHRRNWLGVPVEFASDEDDEHASGLMAGSTRRAVRPPTRGCRPR